MSSRSAALNNSKYFNMTEMEEKIRQAKKDKKIFTIVSGYEPLRQSLMNRGWIEKVPDPQLMLITPTTERYILALFLKNQPFHLIWQPHSRPIENAHNGMPLINSIVREPNFNFTSKDGLNNIALNFHWYHIEGLTNLSYQRSHVMLDKNARDEFIEDFRRTAFTSFLMFLDKNEKDFESFFTNDDEAITTDCVEFSVQKIHLLIKLENHDDLDTSNLFDVCAKFPKHQKEMLNNIGQIKNGTKKFQFQSNFLIDVCKSQVKECVEAMLKQWPHLKYDGFNNVWILKPIGQSSGYGVTVMNAEEQILQAARSWSSKTLIAQKYLENLLLIHNRKFDMRIYFMTFIRDGFVDIWLYKNCYTKFGTAQFRLDNLHKSIHVTNYAVQKYFMNSLDTVHNAKENMWPLSELLLYFESIGKSDVWSNQIYPGIKKNVLAVILASLETTELNVNNFELNGADFMLASDFEPFLIEVNSTPALFFSKTVQDMITNYLLEDVIKVVVDRQRNPSAPTGEFELIHTLEIPKVSGIPVELPIVGTKIERRSARSPGTNEVTTNNLKIDVKMNTNVLLSLKGGKHSNPIYLRENVNNKSKS